METIFKNSYYSQIGKERHEKLICHKMYWRWMYQPLVPWNDQILLLSCNNYSAKEINLQSIVGSIHPDYNGLNSWIEFLGALKKITNDESLIYYSHFFKSSNQIKDGNIIGYNGKYWIAEGNNRICIAKFMGLESIVVPVSEYNTLSK